MPRLLPAASAGAGLEAVFSPPATIPSAYTQVRRIRVATPIAELPVDATPEIDCKAGVDPSGPLEVIDQVDELTVLLRPGKSLRTNVDVCRTGVADPGVCDVVLSTPREISIIGKRPGTTPVTLWPSEGQHGPVTYLVQVGPDAETRQRRDGRYEALEHVLAELFPQSNIRLTPLANRLTVRRQVRDVGRASQIVAVVQDEAVIRRVSTDHPAPEPTDTASFRQTRLENRPPTSTAAPSGHGRFAPTGPANRR